jgi:hypothetical protein
MMIVLGANGCTDVPKAELVLLSVTDLTFARSAVLLAYSQGVTRHQHTTR